ncbi:hypothetical protein ACFY4B_27410 [Kitasatospora sp. NPDC001261]|uniref:hypothetical protein n=1 Tax=Kitasatospora sp. NPDC001261 TaxID=3364012 RepID=UPI0036B4E6D2
MSSTATAPAAGQHQEHGHADLGEHGLLHFTSTAEPTTGCVIYRLTGTRISGAISAVPPAYAHDPSEPPGPARPELVLISGAQPHPTGRRHRAEPLTVFGVDLTGDCNIYPGTLADSSRLPLFQREDEWGRRLDIPPATKRRCAAVLRALAGHHLRRPDLDQLAQAAALAAVPTWLVLHHGRLVKSETAVRRAEEARAEAAERVQRLRAMLTASAA